MSRVSSSSIPTTGAGGSFIAVICAPAFATEITIAQKPRASINAARVADIAHVTFRVLSLVNHVWTLVIGFANIKGGARWCAERLAHDFRVMNAVSISWTAVTDVRQYVESLAKSKYARFVSPGLSGIRLLT